MADQQQAAFINRKLKQFGLGDIASAIAALARTIRDHKHLETMLTSCGPDERQDLYDGVRPHLRFEAKPLDAYVSSAGQMAEREQLPTIGPDGKLLPFRPAADVRSLEKHAEDLLAQEMARRVLMLKCVKCTAEDAFFQIGEETPVAVRQKALKAGWVLFPEEICPTCPSSLRPTND
jgi:hypothetical protein